MAYEECKKVSIINEHIPKCQTQWQSIEKNANSRNEINLKP